MLIEFNFENFRSVKNSVDFSMIANNRIRANKENLIKLKKNNLLKTAAIYGANASGKTNILKAIAYARNFIINSSKESQISKPTGIVPFLLNSESEKAPSTFEFVILLDDKKFRYGFSLNEQEIVYEWLFMATKEKEERLFIRDKQNIQISKEFKEGKGLKEKTRDNALFLSVVANFNGEISKKLVKWFNDINIFIPGENDASHLYAKMFLSIDAFKSKFMKLLRNIDLFIEEINLAPVDVNTISPEFKRYLLDVGTKLEDIPPDIKTIHLKYDGNKKVIGEAKFDLEEQESAGTNRLFSVLGSMLYSLDMGKVILIDELEIKLHPLIVEFLIRLFNSSKYNKNKAQLIFTTHDVNILTRDLLRKDQIWFCEKNKFGETSLFSLNEYKKVRNCDATFYKDYLNGKYKGIPLINYECLFSDENNVEI